MSNIQKTQNQNKYAVAKTRKAKLRCQETTDFNSFPLYNKIINVFR